MTKQTELQIDYAKRLIRLMSDQALAVIEDPVEHARQCVALAEAADLSLHTVVKTSLDVHAVDDGRNKLTVHQREAALPSFAPTPSRPTMAYAIATGDL